jgi:hypothetical protein
MNGLAPIPIDFTSVIALREFVIVRSGVVGKLAVEIGMPIQDVPTIDGYDWRCPVRIIDGVTTRERAVCGADSFQALQLGMRFVQNELEQIATAQGCQIELFGVPYAEGTF